jgi:hypothetical protein
MMIQKMFFPIGQLLLPHPWAMLQALSTDMSLAYLTSASVIKKKGFITLATTGFT